MTEVPSRAVMAAFDIDGTLVSRGPGADEALAELHASLQGLQADPLRPFHYGPATGRKMWSVEDLQEQNPAFDAFMQTADFAVTGVGSSVATRPTGGRLVTDESWPPLKARQHWNRAAIQGIMDRPLHRRRLTLQPEPAQGDFKLSYHSEGVADGDRAFVAELQAALAEENLEAHIIFSSGQFVDFLPLGVNKGSGVVHAVGLVAAQQTIGKGPLVKSAYQDPLLIAACDGMNDADLALEADKVILPGNADESLQSWVRQRIPERSYVAEAHFAAGILEGMRQFGLAA